MLELFSVCLLYIQSPFYTISDHVYFCCVSLHLLMNVIVSDGNSELLICCGILFFFFSWWADSWWGVFDSANWQLPSMQCVVGGGLGLGEVKRCYCLEVSNPTQNKEDRRNVLCLPISVLKAAKVHTRAHTHTHIWICIIYVWMHICTSIHTRTHTTAHHLASYTPALIHTLTFARTHTHTFWHTHAHS